MCGWVDGAFSSEENAREGANETKPTKMAGAKTKGAKANKPAKKEGGKTTKAAKKKGGKATGVVKTPASKEAANNTSDNKVSKEDAVSPDFMRDGHQYWMKYGRRARDLKCVDAHKVWLQMDQEEKDEMHKKADDHNRTAIY